MFHSNVLKPAPCVATVRKASGGIKTIIFKSFGVQKIKKLVVTSNTLTNNLTGWLKVVTGRMWFAGRKLNYEILNLCFF